MKVIAEVGSNWKTLEDCIKSIKLAKSAGADVVKFQYYTNKDLYGVDGERECIPAMMQLNQVAKDNQIEFMCTAFSPFMYCTVNSFVTTHKIASSEITDENILKTVNGFKKPVILSTGGARTLQVANALSLLKDCPVTIMYCVVAYPARVIDFRVLEAYQEFFGRDYSYGYSDHSIDVLNIPKLAEKSGATVLEKHVNFTDHADTPDAPHSLNFHEFKLMVDHLKGATNFSETHVDNPYQRKLITLADGSQGYFRPSVDG